MIVLKLLKNIKNIDISMNKKCNCPICFENECNALTDSNHYFCKNCIDQWFEKSIRSLMCPTCPNVEIILFNIKI